MVTRLLAICLLVPALASAQVLTKPPRVADEGTVVDPPRWTTNFIGAAVTCVDDAANLRTNCTISAGGSVTITEVEVDFGSTFTYGKAVTVTDGSVSGSSKILVTQSGNAATGRQADENEMDKLTCTAAPGSGSFVLHCIPVPGPITGKYKLFYTVG